jgi:beta-phosphoglucomutase-like phosphatase (HAD superfamily)
MANVIQAVIWDLDGVIIDSAEEHRQAWLRMTREEGLALSDAVAGVQAAHAVGMRCIAVAGNRDLPGLLEAELMVNSLTEVDVEQMRKLA